MRARVLIVGMGGLGNLLRNILPPRALARWVWTMIVSIVEFAACQSFSAPKTLVRARWRWQQPVSQPQSDDCLPSGARYGWNIDALIGQYDVIADGCDNFATRYIVNDACFRARKTLVSGAVGQFDGQVATLSHGWSMKTMCCYQLPFTCAISAGG